MNSVSRIQIQERCLQLKHDINVLLGYFNELDKSDSGFISKKGIRVILKSIDVQNFQPLLKAQLYEFDYLLSIIGRLEVPNQPAIYVISFVKILANYRDKSLQNQQTGLQEAKQIDQKIRHIVNRQIERQKQRIENQHRKIYEEMELSQTKQFVSFENEWATYLNQYEQETIKKFKNKQAKTNEFVEEHRRYGANTSRKNSVLYSPKLRDLEQKKKWLVKEGKYNEAIKLRQTINAQKGRLQEHRDESSFAVARKRLESIKRKKQTIMEHTKMNMTVNFNKLIWKKKEGEGIMKIRMKSLRQEAQRKLTQHQRAQIIRLKAMFNAASRH